MPVTLDPDAAAVFKAFQEAGRPAYETLSPAEAREFLLFIAQYAGYPRAAAMLGPVEQAIAEFEKEGGGGN